MKIAVDLNVVLDVVQNRAPHYQDSAEVISRDRKWLRPESFIATSFAFAGRNYGEIPWQLGLLESAK